MVYSIRWQDPALWPGTLRHVPPGFTPVVCADEAKPLIRPHIQAAGLPPWRASVFETLWNAALDRGMQPSGLLLLRLDDLSEVIGHSTTGTVRRWAQFCHRRGLWVNVPGKLMPPPSPGSGLRTRAYLTVRPRTGTAI